jgi:hypothetical protein
MGYADTRREREGVAALFTNETTTEPAPMHAIG